MRLPSNRMHLTNSSWPSRIRKQAPQSTSHNLPHTVHVAHCTINYPQLLHYYYYYYYYYHYSTKVNKTLQDVWPSPVLVHYIYFLGGLLPPNGLLPAAKFTLHPGLAFSYIGSVTGCHLSSGWQPNFVAWYKEWNYGTFAQGATYIQLGGHHVGHRPTL